MDESSIKRAEFYEQKAAEARAQADGVKDAKARRTMLLVGVAVGGNGPLR